MYSDGDADEAYRAHYYAPRVVADHERSVVVADRTPATIHLGSGTGRPAIPRVPGRLRTPLSGLALGVVLHLVRDLITGRGVPLFWPVTGTSVLAPYALYVGLLSLAATWAVLRPARRQPPAAGPQPLE